VPLSHDEKIRLLATYPFLRRTERPQKGVEDLIVVFEGLDADDGSVAVEEVHERPFIQSNLLLIPEMREEVLGDQKTAKQILDLISIIIQKDSEWCWVELDFLMTAVFKQANDRSWYIERPGMILGDGLRITPNLERASYVLIERHDNIRRIQGWDAWTLDPAWSKRVITILRLPPPSELIAWLEDMPIRPTAPFSL
jgi:hypothetical protein